jgi:hypothetical protein
VREQIQTVDWRRRRRRGRSRWERRVDHEEGCGLRGGRGGRGRYGGRPMEERGSEGVEVEEHHLRLRQHSMRGEGGLSVVR